MTAHLIGAMVMLHSDDNGALLPPKTSAHVVVLLILCSDDAFGAVICFASA